MKEKIQQLIKHYGEVKAIYESRKQRALELHNQKEAFEWSYSINQMVNIINDLQGLLK